MSEVKNVNNLIQVGMTRKEFLDKHKQISEEIKNEPVKSIFLAGIDDAAVSRMFDSIVAANDDGDGCDDVKISQADYEKIAAYDGDASSISEEDLIKYYEEILDTVLITSEPVDSDTQSMTCAQSLDMLYDLKILKQQEAYDKKTQLQNEINTLIDGDKSISDETKTKYKNIQASKEQLESLLEKKKREYEANKRNIDVVREQFVSKSAKAAGLDDESEKAELEETISGLQGNINDYEKISKNLAAEISDLNSDIARIDKEMKKIMRDIEKTSSETAKKIKEKQAEIETIDDNLNEELTYLDIRIELAQDALLKDAIKTGAESANYANMSKGNDGHIGKNAAQALSNAVGEIGVREVSGNNDGAAIAKYRNGADNNAAWCASFVSWCYKGNEVFGYQASVSGIQMAAQRQGLYSEKGTYTPKAGDVMIQKNGVSHTGIVESVDPDGTIHTIEGNASNQVKRVTYRPGSKGYDHISGFVRMSDVG